MDTARNIVIIPNKAVIDEAIRRSNLVSKLSKGKDQENQVVLSTEQARWPHITLYQFGLPEANISSLESAVANVAAITEPFNITLQGYELYCGSGIFWMVQKPYEPLQQLHEHLLSTVNEIREGVVPQQHRELFSADSGLSKEQRVMLGQYGYPTALEQYLPHITIGATEVASDIVSELPVDPVDVEVKEIHISNLGPHGTCPGSIKSFKLTE